MTHEYSRVRLITNKYAKDGLPEGTTGYVIEVYVDGNYEVEFSNPETGETLSQLVIAPEDVSECPESDPKKGG